MMTHSQTTARELLVFDLDGTLLNDRHQISESLRDSILHLRNKGIDTTLATGRPYAAVKGFIDELRLSLPLITFNGAVVITVDGEPLSVRPLPRGAASRILEHLERLDVANQLYLNPADNHFYSDRGGQAADYIVEKDGMEYRHVPGLLTLLSEQDKDPVKMFSIGSRPDLEEVQRWIQEAEPSVSCVFSEHDMIEFLGPEVTKGTALSFLCKAIGVAEDSILAFGDNMNDLEMLQTAGTGIAMSAAPEELREAADWVIDDIGAYLASRYNGI